MRSNQGIKSIMLFVFSVAALLLLTAFESGISGLSLSSERIITLMLLVLPGWVGVVFGVLGVIQKESKRWIAVIGILLNGLFASFMTFVLLFAG